MSTQPEPRADLAGERVGLVAGWGRYPLIVAEALRRAGAEVVTVGIKDHADRQLRGLSAAYRELGLGRLGGAIRFLRRHGVRHATMAGKIHKVLMYQPLSWIRHFPDWTCCRTFYPHWWTGAKDRRDDTLLGAVVDAYARRGIEFGPATDYAPELLVKPGLLTHRPLRGGELKDVEFGWALAKEMGRLDVGQSVAVKSRAVLAIEAIEGTDLCIQRAGQLCGTGGFTVVKVAKPQQDMRFDVPTIGRGTIETLHKAGGRVLAVEASMTIVIDEDDVVQCANRRGITIVSLNCPADLRTVRAA